MTAAQLEARFERSDDPDGCWPWIGSINPEGYGRMGDSSSLTGLAHRLVYRTFVDDIPAGLTIDHTCHNLSPDCLGGPTCEHRRCVNPAHLEPVTARENARRARVQRQRRLDQMSAAAT